MKTKLKKEYQWILKEKYNGKESPLFFRDIERLNAGEPLDYIIGYTLFLSSKIDVSNHPFIPRPETEFWVEKAIKEINSKEHAENISCLDIFSGSGCIGISLLRHIPIAKVTFGEKNEKYLEQIEKNIALNDIDSKRAKVIETDFFSSIEGKFHYIFANPPYISKDRLNTVEKSVLDNEPHEALFASDDGLFYIKALLKEAYAYLLPSGKLFIEFDPWQKELIEEYLHNISQQYSKVEFWDDIYDRPRVIVVTK